MILLRVSLAEVDAVVVVPSVRNIRILMNGHYVEQSSTNSGIVI